MLILDLSFWCLWWLMVVVMVGFLVLGVYLLFVVWCCRIELNFFVKVLKWIDRCFMWVVKWL